MDGNIIAIIITPHIPTKEAVAPAHVCPGIRIHAIDMVQPPGMGMPGMADMPLHHSTVATVLTKKRDMQTATKTRSDAFSAARTW